MVLLAAQSGATLAGAPQPQDLAQRVHASLSVADGKKVFRSGEPVRLVTSFTADGLGYQVDTTIDKNARLEEQIEITPEKGVFRWQELQQMPDGYGRDYGTRSKLSSQPVEMKFPLNYWLRFDEPGDYTVRLRTRRVRYSADGRTDTVLPWITTNTVAFTIVMMSDDEERADAQRISTRLDMLSPYDLEGQTRLCEELAFLAGDAASAEKVRRYLNPKGQNTGNWIGDLGIGLYISRKTSLVIGLIEAETRNPSKPASEIWLLVNLRVWMEMPSLVAESRGDMNLLRAKKRARADAIRTEYVNEAIASLPQRTRSARRDTATSLLSLLRSADLNNQSATPTPIPSVLRTIIVEDFAEIDPMMQGHLVQQHWQDIRDPKLLPALERMLESSDTWVSSQPYAAILDLAPERAKPLFIARMLAPRSVSSSAFLQLADQTLPEMDQPLLEQIAGLAASPDSRDKFWLRTKTGYLSRYASGAILKEVQQLYEARGSTMERETRVNLLTYLDRVDETGSPDRLARAVAAETDTSGLIYSLANARYSKAIDAIVKARLDSADPRTAQEAASLLSQHGRAEDRALLEARLNRWITEWSGRTAELEPQPAPAMVPPQAMLQISLIRAIVNGKAWKVSDADAERLRQSCLTERCRAAFAKR
ncbi:MAG TPA: hypothetical protein VFV78_08515 [Vicinamibacterales bacterium]|nr:hypothetical protein [Vicinamibacterales bacterium]